MEYLPSAPIRIIPSNPGGSSPVDKEYSTGPYGRELIRALTELEPLNEAEANALLHSTYQSVGRHLSPYFQGDRGFAAPGVHVAGIAIGSIQSGKTMSFTSAISIAFDDGAAAAIVISGSDTALRDQTRNRLRDYFGNVANVVCTLEAGAAASPAARKALIDSILDGHRKSIIVVMKEDDHLIELQRIVSGISFKMNEQDPPTLLVIDDEGDQGSLNKLAYLQRRGVNKATKLHKIINGICEMPAVAGYVAYTATAYANALTDTDTMIYPKGFVSVLEPGERYTGLDAFFSDPAGENSVTGFASGTPDAANEALIEAVDHFMLVCEANELLRGGQAIDGLSQIDDGCLVMGINAGERNNTHFRAEKVVRTRLEEWKSGVVSPINMIASARLISGSEGSELEKIALNAGDWARQRAIRLSLNVVMLNQFGDVSSRDFKTPYDRIVIGGKLLGRGFTLPRLVSYVLVPSQERATMDILQQRARFLGYRRSYMHWMRVWLDFDAKRSYGQLAKAEFAFRRAARILEQNGTGLDALDAFIVLAGNHAPAARGAIVRGRKETRAWWASRPGSYSTPAFFDTWAKRVLEDGVLGRRGERSLVISATEARELVDEYCLIASADAGRMRGGLELSIGPKQDPDSDATVTLYIMSLWESGRKRGRDEYGNVKNLFSGRDGADDADPNNAETQIYDKQTSVSIQLHRLQLPEGGLGIGMAVRPTDVVIGNRSLWILE